MPREDMQVKAVRLVAEGKVVPMGTIARFEVEGEHGVYRVLVDESGAIDCQCKAWQERGSCSHATACAAVHGWQVDGLDLLTIRAHASRMAGAGR